MFRNNFEGGFFGGKKRKLDIAAIEKRVRDEAPLDLEKGDFFAMMVAGLMVFMPLALGFSAFLWLFWWVFVGRF